MHEDDDGTVTSRRRMLGGIAGGGLALALGGAPLAARAAAAGSGGTPEPLRTPLDLYPKPPFPAQQQPWPGLASRMTPRPDHGEASYKGSGRLAGRRALITGGDSGIGRAVAIAFARGAAIVNTTSVQAYDPSHDLVDYAMTKAGIENFTKSMAKQLLPRGIRVNGIAPGPVWTPLQVTGGATEEKIVQFGKQTPMQRPAQPAELAGAYVELAASSASYVTGQIFGLTGGVGQP